MMIIMWTALIVVGLILLKPKATTEDSCRDGSCSLKSIVQNPKFGFLYAMNFCSVFYGYIVIGNYKVFASTLIKNDLFLTTVGSIASICGSLRFIWAIQLDNGYSYSRVYGVLSFLQLICATVIHESAHFPTLFLLVVALSVFCEGGHFVLLPAHCVEVFGSTQAGV